MLLGLRLSHRHIPIETVCAYVLGRSYLILLAPIRMPALAKVVGRSAAIACLPASIGPHGRD
jgi:histidinol dehydrogenase